MAKMNVTENDFESFFQSNILKGKGEQEMDKEKIKSAIKKTIRYMNGNYYSKFEEKMIVGYLKGALKELED